MLWDALPALGEWKDWDHLPTTDELGQWSGLTLYRTDVRADDGVLSFDEVRDRAIVHLDNEPVGVLARTEKATVVALPHRAGTLDVLLEDQGRVDYGPRLGEAKGLIGPARTATRELTAWQTLGLRLRTIDELLERLRLTPATPGQDAPIAGPVFCHGSFATTAGVDHFLRTDGWGKGLAWVNGFLLGRYWSAGPTRTLYIPGPLMRAEGNELVLLELHGTASGAIAFAPGPDLGHTDF
jgi:beta-galactosidase